MREFAVKLELTRLSKEVVISHLTECIIIIKLIAQCRFLLLSELNHIVVFFFK